MSSMAPKRMHSTTRLSRRPDGFSIFYQHGKGDVEEEMMRVSVITNGDADTLRSSNSESVLTEKPSMKKKKKDKKKKKTSSSRRTHFSFLEKWNETKRKPFKLEFMNEDTTRILNELKTLNGKIRMRFQVEESPSFAESMDKLTKEKNRNLSFFSSESSESSEFSPSRKTVSSHNSPILTAEAFDYRGKPLQPCWTPFPRSNPSKSNRKANESKKKKKNSKESTSSSSGSSFIKPPVPPVSDSSSSFVSTASFQSNKSKKSKESSPIQLKRVSSDTKFPCARSPATRKKMRKLLKEYAEKKVKKQKETAEFHSREDANLANILKGMIKEKKKPEDTEEKKTNDSEEKSITSTSSSMKTIYSKSDLTVGCDTCSSCTGCINYCFDEHTHKKKKKNNGKINSMKKSKKVLETEVF